VAKLTAIINARKIKYRVFMNGGSAPATQPDPEAAISSPVGTLFPALATFCKLRNRSACHHQRGQAPRKKLRVIEKFGS
jgi:hypothetical protein